MQAQYSLKKTGIIYWLSIVALNVRNQFAQVTFFLASWIMMLLKTVFTAAIFFFMGEFVAKGAAPHIAQYGMSYGSYIVIGLIFNRVLSSTLDMFHQQCLFGYWATQFDTYLAYPGGVSAFFAGGLINEFIFVGLNTAIFVLVGVAFFSISVSIAHLPSLCLMLILGIISLIGLGLLGASSFTLLNSKRWGSNPINWIVNFAVTLLAGVYFPPSVLPEWLQRLSEWLPQTRILRSARLILGGQALLSDPVIAADIAYLLRFTAVSLPIGAVLFAWGMRKAQRDGTLSRWA